MLPFILFGIVVFLIINTVNETALQRNLKGKSGTILNDTTNPDGEAQGNPQIFEGSIQTEQRIILGDPNLVHWFNRDLVPKSNDPIAFGREYNKKIEELARYDEINTSKLIANPAQDKDLSSRENNNILPSWVTGVMDPNFRPPLLPYSQDGSEFILKNFTRESI